MKFGLKNLIDFLAWGTQKLSKNFPYAIKEIHNYLMLLTRAIAIPLMTNECDFFNMKRKDIHRIFSLICRYFLRIRQSVELKVVWFIFS